MKAIKFVPASSVGEAAKFAKTSGVIDVNYSKMPLHTANTINAALLTVPKTIRPIYISDYANAFALYGCKPTSTESTSNGVCLPANAVNLNGKMYFNKSIVGINTARYKTLDDITAHKLKTQDIYTKSHRGRAWSLNTEGELVPLHEMGHVIYRSQKFDKWSSKWRLACAGWATEAQVDILSDYPEAFGEMWAAYHGGYPERLPDRIITFKEGLKL